MPPTIGLVANVFNEINALPGWLETHLPYFDDVRILHAGPQGEYSTDGTIELLEKWHIPVEFCAIDEGFGVVRTRAIHSSPCDYVMILDADERFYPVHRVLTCAGEGTPHSEVDAILQTYHYRGNGPDWDNLARLGAKLRVDMGEVYNQGKCLRLALEKFTPDVVVSIRRHWHDFSFRRPTQNWHVNPDWQGRIVRNIADIQFDAGVRMHERLIGGAEVVRAEYPLGPYFEHFHFTMKRMEEKQRKHDIDIYNAIHEGRTPPKQND